MSDTKTKFDLHNLDRDHLLEEAKQIARDAGSILMGFYNAAKADPDSLKVVSKDDNSPVTIADKKSSEYIETKLMQLTPDLEVMSEENTVAPDGSMPYWAIDPLDGTKLFINQTGGFAVNIALILDGEPILGVINAPALDLLYYSAEGLPAYKEDTDIVSVMTSEQSFKKGDLSAHFDAAHADVSIYEAQRKRLARENGLELPEKPDAVRLQPSNMMVADGDFDLHVKTGDDPSLQESAGHVWDNAPDFIILKNAGGTMIDMTSGEELRFDQGRGRQPAYISFGSKDLANQTYPPKPARKPKP